MTLAQKQESLKFKVDEIAKANNLSTPELYPIYDGVCDFSGYEKSELKVMWVLKEPYDELEGDIPSGGGWSIPEHCFIKDDAWKNPAWKNIIYVMYGFLNNKTWNDINWLRNEPSMAEVLKQIAYINVSKMPALTDSKDAEIAAAYKIWKPLLFEQIKMYSPDVIIFCNTFSYFQNDIIDATTTKLSSSEMIDVYKKNNVYLLDCYHPSRKGQEYVDTIIAELNKIKAGKR